MTETDRILARIAQGAAQSLSLEEILARYLEEWLLSPVRREMLTGQQYYCNDNDIRRHRRLSIGPDGQLVEDKTLPCRQISHGFVRKLVDQKSQYLFGRPFTVSAADPAFASLLGEMFDRQLRDRMKNICKEAVNKGIAWLQVWPEDGALQFRRIPAEEVVPIWADGEHTRLEGLLHFYQMDSYEGRHRETVCRVEYWDSEKVRFYTWHQGRLEPDPFCPDKPHLTLNGQPVQLPFLPFVAFKYNEEELPLIRFVKPLVDDYDLLKSEDSSNLTDTSGAIMVLRNYDGTDLGEFRQNLSRFRAVKVSDGGGLEIRENPVHTAAVLSHLAQDRKDIYEIGRGVDTQTERLGQASGVAMKFLYADLDLDCSGIESQFAAGFDQLIRLAALYYALMGRGDFTGQEAQIIINRDIIVSEEDAIDGCVQSAGLLSRRTILENHPWITDAGREMERLAAEGVSEQKEGGI